MDVQAATGGERAMRRTMVLLVALADLAERAAARSWPVRCFVLFLLRFAETVAADFVLEATGLPAPVIEGFAAHRNSPEDALLLAIRLRLLAAALGDLLGPDGLSPGRSASVAGALRRFASRLDPLLAIVPVGWTPRPFDTS